MTLDIKKLREAINPIKPLFKENVQQDEKYYIDFSPVRGAELVEELKKNIVQSPQPTYQLFTGHIGCGKSTELRRLKAKLQKENYHVVYFDYLNELELEHVDLGDILLRIASQVSDSLKAVNITVQATGFRQIIQNIANVLRINLKSFEISVPGIDKVTVKNGEWSIPIGIAKITIEAKKDRSILDLLKKDLELQVNKILNKINQELILPAIEQLQNNGKQGLVVIVDNFEKIETYWTISQQEHLFIDQYHILQGLECHMVYTMPLELMFSSSVGPLRNYWQPKILPMVPVKLDDGSDCKEGRALLRQMVLARAFPELKPNERLEKIAEMFDEPQTLDRLCYVSGGHPRNLLKLLLNCIFNQDKTPISSETLEKVIAEECSSQEKGVEENDWNLIYQVYKNKGVGGNEKYSILIRTLLVYEYQLKQKSWFDINPILAEAEHFKQFKNYHE